MDVVERFWSHVDKSGDCWLWTAGLNDEGYGVFHSGTSVSAHRYAYVASGLVIPDGLELDHRHTCPKRCVRPEHLRPATSGQNSQNRSGANANSKTGVQGVWYEPHRYRWKAVVQHQGKSCFVGRFFSLEEAEAAVVAKRNELFTFNDRDRVVTP